MIINLSINIDYDTIMIMYHVYCIDKKILKSSTIKSNETIFFDHHKKHQQHIDYDLSQTSLEKI
jgi:hypothetical protein